MSMARAGARESVRFIKLMRWITQPEWLGKAGARLTEPHSFTELAGIWASDMESQRHRPLSRATGHGQRGVSRVR